MQYQCHKDMLDKEKCQLLQHKMDAFLGPNPFLGTVHSAIDRSHWVAMYTDGSEGILRAGLPTHHPE